MSLLRRFRAPLTAVVALVFSASVALAAAPTAPGGTGLANAASHAGKTVPVKAADEQVEETVTVTETETESSTESDASDSADHCNVDLTQDPSVLAGLSHGSIVCSAAHQDPPDGYSQDGFANHGAWVRSFAKGDHGSSQSPTGKGHKPSSND
jgi:hypothetical protein